MTSLASRAVRGVVKKIIRTSMRVYFEKIEVRGRRHLPVGQAAILAGNHPSGLVDPMVLMTALPDLEMSSVAKHSLFSLPVVAFFMRALRTVPVAKTFDPGLPPEKQPTREERQRMNMEMFATVENLLGDGVNIVIFPEGTCHSTYEIKELKGGTARMSLGIAASGGPRIPIVPIGLAYSAPSGSKFRSKVLVDIGWPVEVTDELVELYKTDPAEAARQMMATYEERLRHVTVHSPNWVAELGRLAQLKGFGEPSYTIEAVGGKSGAIDGVMATTECSVWVGGQKFTSRAVTASRTADSNRLASKLKLAAARDAYFTLSGAAGTEAHRDTDFDLIDTIKLSRRIYKPANLEISLAQYGALARNFSAVAIHRLDDPEFQQLYRDVKAYERELRALGVSDDYVALHAIGSDPFNERLRALRRMARRDLAKTALMAPLSAVGAVLHAPVAALAVAVGRYIGVEADGDKSVEATMRLLSGFLSLLVLYPTAAFGAAWACGSAWVAAPAMGLCAASGYAAATRPIWQDTVQSVMGSFKLLTKRDNVDRLREKRAALTVAIRTFADKHAPAPEMRGWWRDPETATEKLKQEMLEDEAALRHERLIVTPESIASAGLVSYFIPLRGEGKRHPDEHAVLTCKQVPGNANALVWIPGRNDSFFHVHVLDRFLAAGFDVHALDMRRCGRAQFSPSGDRVVDELLAHDTHDFREYFEEMDATFRWLKNPGALPDGKILTHGGCGKAYENIVLYAHSTGALPAALYGADRDGGAWRGAIDGFVFNSPFWDWNVTMYERVVIQSLQHASKVGLPESFPLAPGGSPSAYSLMIHDHYGFTPELRSLKELTVTAGWVQAVDDVQKLLRKQKIKLQRPTLVLTTHADEVLDAAGVHRAGKSLSKDGSHGGRKQPLWSSDLVARQVGTDAKDRSAHDVLAAPSPRRVDEAMRHIEEWLRHHFSDFHH